MENSVVLLGYTIFVEKVRKYQQEYELYDAVNQAIDECIAEDILADFMEKNREEVLKVTVIDCTFEQREKLIARDNYQEGLAEGRITSQIELIIKKIQKHKTVEQIADELEEEIAIVEPLVEHIMEFAPEYNMDSILATLGQ